MSDCTNCKSIASTNVVLEDETIGCQTYVHETVCVQGTVTITPDVKSGPSMSFCVGNPIIGSCPGELAANCQFTVSQNICVQIPLTFKAEATAVPNGLVCGTPTRGLCPGEAIACTHTIGYFRRHNADITKALIAANGGSIMLGTGGGLSYEVTADNSLAVLSLNTPSPPAPEDPPNAHQYENLYAQLLAARLNQLAIEALDVEVCQDALDAMDAADQFLDDSPEGGLPNASDYGDPLESFNSGNMDGCPEHCPDDDV